MIRRRRRPGLTVPLREHGVTPILAALGTPAATLRAAVADACRATGEPPQR